MGAAVHWQPLPTRALSGDLSVSSAGVRVKRTATENAPIAPPDVIVRPPPAPLKEKLVHDVRERLTEVRESA